MKFLPVKLLLGANNQKNTFTKLNMLTLKLILVKRSLTSAVVDNLFH